MAPRAYWKGYLKLSLVSCPVALFPATSEREKISFHQLNKKTGHRIKYRKVDAESGDEVDSADIIKGYEVGKGDYIELLRGEGGPFWILPRSCSRRNPLSYVKSITLCLPRPQIFFGLSPKLIARITCDHGSRRSG
jgi:hypothetical protein